ncbi:hypothetical protein SteCoe_37251 [Stentor coeruleus]|uniref:RBR-type E3 ubiquitin transferase n=1 Tax=Stentor coeruleus TaxID=5963 RepID=A0A1R2ANI3_9CILI|nr:hypothetical protein SteCoe_37251 [Stentor coeruleus]
MASIYIQEEEKLNASRYSYRSGIFSMLLDMGFKFEFINSAVNYTNSLNIEVLIGFMTKSDSGWEHEFIINDQNVCEICGDIESEHIAALPLPEENREMIKIQFKTIEGRRSQSFTKLCYMSIEKSCGICFEVIKPLWSLPSCQIHYFCRECIKQLLKTKIINSQVLKISCPGENCPSIFTYDDIKLFLSIEYLAKYEKFVKRQQVINDPTLKFCIIPDCEGIIKGSVENPCNYCSVCNFEICFLCLKPWHEGKTCEEIQIKEFDKWVEGKDVKDCPNCKYKIEKNLGCEHMTCINCHYEFCWICFDPWEDNHFSIGCRGIQVPSNDISHDEDINDGVFAIQYIESSSGENNDISDDESINDELFDIQFIEPSFNENLDHNQDLDHNQILDHNQDLEFSYLRNKLNLLPKPISVLIEILICVFCPLLMLLVFLFSPAIAFTWVVSKKSFDSEIKRWVILILVFIAAFIFTPVMYAMGILLFPCLIAIIIKELKVSS